MSLIFNRVPADLEAFLQREARRRQLAVEEVAIEALKRGVAFSEKDETDDVSFAEDPRFDEALHAFAEMERE